MEFRPQPYLAKLPFRPKTAVFIFGLAFSFYQPMLLGAAESNNDSAPLITGNQQNLSLSATLFKTLGSLVIVIGLMLLLLYFIRKAGLAKTGIQQNQLINIIDSRMVAPKKQVAVLKIGDEYIVVGITEQNINLLTTIENNAAIEQAIAASPSANGAASFSFASALNKAMGKEKKTTQDI